MYALVSWSDPCCWKWPSATSFQRFDANHGRINFRVLNAIRNTLKRVETRIVLCQILALPYIKKTIEPLEDIEVDAKGKADRSRQI